MQTSDANLYSLLMEGFSKARSLVLEKELNEDLEMPADECHAIVHENYPMLQYRPWINLLLGSAMFQGDLREDSVLLLAEAIKKMHVKNSDTRYEHAAFTLNMMLCAFDQKGPS